MNDYQCNLPTYKHLYPVPNDLPVFPIEKDPQNIVGAGNDSTVYRVDDKVYKQYTVSTPMQALLAYKDIIQRTKELFEALPTLGAATLKIHNNTLPYFFEINPIEIIGRGYFTKDSIRISPHTFPLSISTYIPGPVLSVFSGYTSERGFSHANNQLPEPERSFVYSIFWGSINSSDDFKKFDEIPGKLSKVIQHQNQYAGLNVGDVNVKVRYDLNRNAIRFVVTDLCTHLEHLRKIR